MPGNVFISNSLNESIIIYLKNKDREYSLEFNSFLCTVFRLLVLIYGEDDLIASFHENNSENFDNCITKYGYDIDDLDEFKVNFEKYYMFSKKQTSKTIKKKNKYFNLVQKSLIDMMSKRKEKTEVSKEELDDFTNLLFTACSSNFYRSSVAVLEAYNPYEIDIYAKNTLGVG